MKRMKTDKKRPLNGIEKLARLALLSGAGWVVYSNTLIDHNSELPDAIAAERKVIYLPEAGKLSYYADRQAGGRPLVLVHSVNAAASALEMRPLFDAYRAARPVFALDLPGYGFSERSNRDYTPAFFANTLVEFLRQEVGEAADVVALSLGGEFAARAAVQAPDLFHTLTLISPSGLSSAQGGSRSQKAVRSGRSQALHRLFSMPLWKRPFFDLLATRRSIAWFLDKSFTGPVPPVMISYAYATAHQPGAENVPLRFISGSLFSPDIRTDFYEKLAVPTLVIYDHDPYTGFETLPEVLQSNTHWRAVRIIPTLGLPHWEQTGQTTNALDTFWSDINI